MKKFNIKPRTEIINAEVGASYVKSDNIGFQTLIETSVLWNNYISPLAEMQILYGFPHSLKTLSNTLV